MDSFSAVIDALGGAASFGEGIGVSDSHARTMKARDSIPPAYWEKTVALAVLRGVQGVSFALLARLSARRSPQPNAPIEAAL